MRLVGNFNPPDANFDNPAQIKIDSAGNAWVANEGGSVTELTSSGGLAGHFTAPGAHFSGSDGLAIDASGNVWVANPGSNSVAQIIGAAGPVLTPLVACLTKTPANTVCLP